MFEQFWGRGDKFQTHDAVKMLFYGFTLLGLNPSQKFLSFYNFYSVIMMFCVIIAMPLAFNLSYFFNSNDMSASQFLTSLQVSINVSTLPVKVIALRYFLQTLRRTEIIMKQLDKRCSRHDELTKLRQVIIFGNRIVLFFFSTYITYSITTYMCSVSAGHPPYSLYLPFINWRNSRKEFYIQSTIEFMIMNLACSHQAIDDVYTVIYIYIIRSHLQLLAERIRRLGKNENKTQNENYADLVQSISDHKTLIELLKTISPLISITIFVQFLTTAAVLGTTMINIFIFADKSAQFGAISYFFAVQLQTAPCCYQASWLMEDSNDLSLAIFQCHWANQSVRFRKLLVFFMQRAQKTMIVTAMKIFPINLNTNLAIAKFSFSLYTLIKKMDFGQNLKN